MSGMIQFLVELIGPDGKVHTHVIMTRDRLEAHKWAQARLKESRTNRYVRYRVKQRAYEDTERNRGEASAKENLPGSITPHGR